MTILNDNLPDIQFALSEGAEGWKTVVGEDNWWYVYGEPDSLNENGETYVGYKEGIYISIHGEDGNYYGMNLSTEVIVDMLRTLAQRITGSENIGLALAEAPDRGIRRVE